MIKIQYLRIPMVIVTVRNKKVNRLGGRGIAGQNFGRVIEEIKNQDHLVQL